MELDLPVDNIVNELALDNEFRGEVLKPTDLFGINNNGEDLTWGAMYSK